MFFFQIDRKNNATTILLNNKECKEIQAHGQCSGSWKHLTKFSGNSAYQCAETLDVTCKFYKIQTNDNLIASCDYKIEDQSYYNIACRLPTINKDKIPCCILNIENEFKGMSFEWGTGTVYILQQ